MRSNTRAAARKRLIIFPIATLVLVGLIFAISSAYKPNWTFDWSDIRPEVKDNVLYLAEYGDISTGVVGYSAVKPMQFDARIWLMNYATDSELNKLKTYPAGNIKAAVYESLLRRGKENPIELLEECLSDSTAFFNYQSGCTGRETLASEYILHEVLHLKEASDSASLVTLTLEQKEDLLGTLNEQLDRKWELYEKYFDPRQ